MSATHGPGGPGCRELLGQLSDYLDGDLDPSVCEAIDEHVADCPPCEAFLQSLRRTVAHLKRVESASIPPDMKREIVEAWTRLQKGH